MYIGLRFYFIIGNFQSLFNYIFRVLSFHTKNYNNSANAILVQLRDIFTMK